MITGRRVVVTGLSAITPIGNDLSTSWEGLLAGRSGAAPITRFDTQGFTTTFACEVKGFDPLAYLDKKMARRMDYFTQYAVAAARMLMEDSGYRITEENAPLVGAILGCGLGGLETIEDFHATLMNKGPQRLNPFSIPMLIANMASGLVSMETGAKGPNLATTSACASGTHSVGYAFSEVKLGRMEAMICGGAESTISPLGVGGFNAMKTLSTRNHEPEKASRPFDVDRDGFVIGEGAGLLLLEDLESAQKRGARIYAEVAGFGASSDAYHITAPDTSGYGQSLAMATAMREAGVGREDIDHINAHGTSTSLNDVCETKAVKTLLGEHAHTPTVTSNKSNIGHTLGAAGGIESVFTVMSIAHGKVPATINLENPDPECDLNYVMGGTLDQDVGCALCNSFGFGGTNGCVLFKKFED